MAGAVDGRRYPGERPPATAHDTSVGAVFQRVLDEVLDDLEDLIAIADDDGLADAGAGGCRRLTPRSSASGPRASRTSMTASPRSTSPAGEMCSPSSMPDRLIRSSISRRIRVGLFMHDGQESLSGLFVIARMPSQRLDETRQRRQRRAKFVAGVGQEVRLGALAAPKLGLVTKNKDGQPLVAPFIVERRGERAPDAILGAARLVHHIARLGAEQRVVDDAQDLGRTNRRRQRPGRSVNTQQFTRGGVGEQVAARVQVVLVTAFDEQDRIGEPIQHLAERGHDVRGQVVARSAATARPCGRSPRTCAKTKRGRVQASDQRGRRRGGKPMRARKPSQQQRRGDARHRRHDGDRRPTAGRTQDGCWICHGPGRIWRDGMILSQSRGVSGV